MSDTCEQEIKFEVPCKYFEDNFDDYNIFYTVQVGPLEECRIWGEIWMVDKPT